MPRAVFGEPTAMSEKSDMIASARFASRFFRVVSSMRSRYGLEYEEIVIFFGLGRLNFDLSQGEVMMIKPTNIVSLAEFLDIPRETLRRKLMRLEEKDLVQRTSYGFVVKDTAVWRRLGELAQQGPESNS
jgi:hypothetical protein